MFFFYQRYEDPHVLKEVAVSQDASASAYQIMSYFMLDTKMGEKTNLISSPTGNREDIYTCFKKELLSYLAMEYKKSGNEDIYNSIKGVFSRKFVKKIFMPMIYGKTTMSTCEDIRNDVKQFISGSACMKLTNYCFEFWKCKYSHMYGFINLIKTIGWMNSMCEQPVCYRTPNVSSHGSKICFYTLQDYRIMDSYHIWVYDRQLRKKRRVSLRVESLLNVEIEGRVMFPRSLTLSIKRMLLLL